MKNILFILCLFISFLSYGQVITTNTPGAVPRSNKATKAVEDFNLAARTNFFVPRMDDTTQANTNATMDTCGRLVYTYDVDGYWYRRCTPSRHWERVGGSASVILPQCGIANGTGIVTWDSLLVFDVTASLYALCCDNVARVTPDTVIVLPPSDPDNPRIDAIVLTRNGIEIDTGIAQANPALPQLDSCELLLTYVLINAGETVPAFVTPNNPLSIYDENYTTEWIIDSIHNITMDTADVTFPVHLTKDIKITSYTVTDNFFEFHTDSTINLNDYGALKLYIRSPSANGPIRVFFTWYLDGQQQTISQFTQSLPAMASPVYNIIVVPISNFSTLSGASTSVNNLRINISGGSTTFYIDWIQLQSGIPAPASPTGIQSFSSGNLSPLFNTQVAINGSQIVQSFIQQPAGSYTVLSNRTNVSGSYSFGKIDLSTPIITGLLPIINVAPSANDGDFVQTVGGLSSWVTLTNDTTFVGNGLVRRADPNSNNDTLYFGYSKADTASFAFDTYLNQNNFFLAMQKGRFEEYKGTNTAAANNLTLPSDGNTVTITGSTQINAITTARWQAGSQIELIFTGTPTVKNNTAGGAGTATILLAGSTDFVAAANDVLSLVYDGTNWHESARKTSSGSAITLNNGLTLTGTNGQLGGSLVTNTTITTSSTNFLNVTGTNGVSTNGLFNVSVTGANNAGIFSFSTAGKFSNTQTPVSIESNFGVEGISSGNNMNVGVYGTASGIDKSYGGFLTAYRGLIATDNNFSNTPSNLIFVSNGATITRSFAAIFAAQAPDADTATIINVASYPTSSTSAGMGGAITFSNANNGVTPFNTNKLISRTTVVSGATSTSQFAITGVDAGTEKNIIFFEGDKRTRFNGRAEFVQGADVASTGTMVLGSDGNLFEITGTADINTISNLTWQNGSVIYLQFTSTAKLKNGQATSGTDVTILLAGAADFTGSANDVVTLVYGEIGGTVAWREVSRSVN